MYDFLRKPAWILSHVLVAAAVVAMVALGFWQRSRWQEVSTQNDRYQAQMAGRVEPLSTVVGPDVRTVGQVPAAAQYRHVVVTGRYDTANEVEVRSRSQGGAPGAWVLTPLVQADGTVVPVVRGWIPLELANTDPPFEAAAPPPGDVTVTGVVQLTQVRGALGPQDPATGRLQDLSRVDVARFAQQLDAPVVPVWVLLDGQRPPQPAGPGGTQGLPQQVTLDLRSPSTNFSYMVQWWIFATIAVIGYPLVLRRVARNRARGDEVPLDDVPTEVPAADRDGSAGPPVATGA